jgi:hypothetical protein
MPRETQKRIRLYFARFLEACQLAYDSPQIQAGPDGRDGASLIEADDCRILAFRGTVSTGSTWRVIEDWLNDLHANQIHDERFPGKVHAGFASSLTALWPAIMERAEATAQDKPLVITGHSKGGSLSFLAGWLFRALRPAVVTFGAAMVANHEFASAYDLLTYRFENPGDRVPHLPPVLYASCGSCVMAPRSFAPSASAIENHQIETGYKPWVA